MLASTGCEFRDLWVRSGPLLEVEADWTPSLNEASVNGTAMLFDEEGRSVKTENVYKPDTTTLLPVGKGTYDVVLFNGVIFSPDDPDIDLDGLMLRGGDHIDTFEAVASQGTRISRLGSRGEDEYIATNEMAIIASAVQRQQVDEDGTDYIKYKNGHDDFDLPEDYVYARMEMTPVPLSYEAKVIVDITNISSAAGASAALYGFVGSAFMASREPSHFYVTHQFNLTNRKVLNKTEDIGTIESPMFVTFGPPLDAPDNKYEVYLKMVLVNGEEREWTVDVGDQVFPIVEAIKTNLSGGATIRYRLQIPITIEVELPTVEDIEGNVNLEDWGDDELIVAPIMP
jgi:hypothetical protein